jgi:hypothetical protein
MMHRRRFLSLLGMAAPAMALDPERLLWVPGRVAIFDLGVMPARGGAPPKTRKGG